jgi:hypothetical protein
VARRLIALVGGTCAAVAPAVTIMGWPFERVFQTRFLLPGLVLETCATVALAFLVVRSRWARAVIFAFCFVAANALVLRAFEERRLQANLDRCGDQLRGLVAGKTGLVVIVSRAHLDQSPEETVAKATARWPIADTKRLVMIRPGTAEVVFGARSRCASPESFELEQVIRWPHAEEPIRSVLWDTGDWAEQGPDLEPYFEGCRSR